MRRAPAFLCVLGLVLALLACAEPLPTDLTPEPAPPREPQPGATPKVAIISIDGLRPDAIVPANAPNIVALAKRGAYTWQAQTILPSTTLPSHASMLSGYAPAGHGIDWDDFRPERGVIRVETLFSRAHLINLRTVMVVGKEKLRHLNVPGSVDTYVFAPLLDQDVANQAVVQAGTSFDLLFVHLPETDLKGHANGWMSPTYLQQLAKTDQAVGRILAALPSETTVILTADHGGQGSNHGTNAPADMTIPWIIAGPKILRNVQLSTRVRTMDTAATAAEILGVELAEDATSQVVREAFVGSGGTSVRPGLGELPGFLQNVSESPAGR